MGGVNALRKNSSDDNYSDFTGLVLCDYRSERVDVHVRASVVGGALHLSCQDRGPTVEEIWGDEEGA